jgi:flagellar basal body-associated protein FliL
MLDSTRQINSNKNAIIIIIIIIIITPVIIGAAGTISNSFSKYLSNIPERKT